MKWRMVLLQRLRLAAIATGWAAALVGGATLAFVAVPALVARADTARSLNGIDVRFVDAPRWMSPADLAPLEELVREQLTGSPFDHDGLRIAADGLRASGWFEGLSQVRRASLSLVEVSGVWTIPTALVSDAEGEHLIDSNGRRLPRSYIRSAAPAFPRILGYTGGRPAAMGERYSGTEIPAALSLLRAIDEYPFRTQVAAIDVSRHSIDGSLTLITNRDAKLRWGRPPGEGSAAEVPTRQKLAYLQFLFDHYGRIDAVGDGEIDLTGDYVGAKLSAP